MTVCVVWECHCSWQIGLHAGWHAGWQGRSVISLTVSVTVTVVQLPGSLAILATQCFDGRRVSHSAKQSLLHSLRPGNVPLASGPEGGPPNGTADFVDLPVEL